MRLAGTLMVFAMLAPANLGAQDTHSGDLAGTWELSVSVGWGATFELKQEGDRITGEADLGEGAKFVLDGRVQGHNVDFVIDMVDGPHPFTVSFGGTMEGEKMEGTVSMEDGSRADWTLIRVDGP